MADGYIGGRPKRVTPMEYLMGLDADLSDRDTALRTEEGKWIVDTCFCSDTGFWETGISVEGKLGYGGWFIVQQYPDAPTAEAGHNRWVHSMQENPDRELDDIYHREGIY
jgi:hypothetical protein